MKNDSINLEDQLYLSETDSTNNQMSRLLEKGCVLPDGFVVITDYQKAGRGQVGNSWYSERGVNLLFTVLFQPKDLSIANQFYLSEVASVAIADALSSLLSTDEIRIKWPNDLYFRDKKIAGILVENIVMSGVIEQTMIGVGLNVNQENFPDWIPNPISMKQVSNHDFEREVVLNEILSSLKKERKLVYEKDFSRIKSRYIKRLYRYNTFSKFIDSNGITEARIVDVESSGKLVIKSTEGNTSKYYFKEISYCI